MEFEAQPARLIPVAGIAGYKEAEAPRHVCAVGGVDDRAAVLEGAAHAVGGHPG